MKGAQRKTRAPCGALEGVGYGGVSPREDKVKIALTGKRRVNGNRIFTPLSKPLKTRTLLHLAVAIAAIGGAAGG